MLIVFQGYRMFLGGRIKMEPATDFTEGMLLREIGGRI
jgi:hypothetical protein